MAHGDHLKYQAKPKAGRQTLFRLTSYLVCDRLLLSVIGVLIVLSIAANLGGSYLLRPIINRYIIPGDFLGLGKMLGILIGVYLTGVFAVYVEYRLLNKIGQRTVARMREDLFRKMEQLPVGYFDTHQHGDLMSRYTNDMDRISDALTDSLSDMLSSALTVVGIFCLMLVISPILTLVTLVTVPLMFWSARGIVRKSRQYFKAQQASLGSINGYIEEMISGQKVVKVFGHEQKAISDFEELNQDLKGKSLKAQFYSGLMMPVMNFVSNLGYVAVAIAGALFAIGGRITVGDIQAFIQYVKNFTQPITQLAQVSNVLQQMAASAERVFAFLEAEEESKTAVTAKTSDISGGVEFNHVHFGYEAGKPIIKDFSATVQRGQTVALVGPTGAGKTTIIKLLMRFYDVDSGSIRVGGHDVREFDRNDLRSLFGMVLQDTWLFKGTIRENIRYGRLDATDEEVEAAAKAAFADHFIRTLPGGYDMEINEDASNISQGQRQLLTIARAILADRRMLILDEATSSVDTRTEERIQMAMDNLMEGRTSFVIAHRLSTIRNADLILVLREGDIVEQGNHDELLVKGGAYAELYNSQFAE